MKKFFIAFLALFVVFFVGCAVDHLHLELHNARTAGMEATSATSTAVETAVQAVEPAQ